MNGDDRPFIPRIDPALYQRVNWYLCQIVYVTAKELMRSRPATEWVDAYQEAWDLAQALNQSGRPLTPSVEDLPGMTAAPPPVKGDDLVHWPTLICFLNSYAKHDAEDRAAMRKDIAGGAALWEVGIGGPAVMLGKLPACDKKAVADPEYYPEPPCLPLEVATFLGVAAGSFVCASALALVVRAIRR